MLIMGKIEVIDVYKKALVAANAFLYVIPVSKMICQQITAIVKVEANHLANKYAREYNLKGAFL